MNFSASWQFSIININGVQIYPTWINDYCPILPHLSRNAQIVPVSLYISHISLSLRLSHSLTPCLSLSLSPLPLSYSLNICFFLPYLSLKFYLHLSDSHSLSRHLSLVPLLLSHSHSLTFSLSHSLALTLSLSHSLTLSLSHSLTFTSSHFLPFYLSHSHSLTPSLSHSLTLSLS